MPSGKRHGRHRGSPNESLTSFDSGATTMSETVPPPCGGEGGVVLDPPPCDGVEAENENLKIEITKLRAVVQILEERYVNEKVGPPIPNAMRVFSRQFWSQEAWKNEVKQNEEEVGEEDMREALEMRERQISELKANVENLEERNRQLKTANEARLVDGPLDEVVERQKMQITRLMEQLSSCDNTEMDARCKSAEFELNRVSSELGLMEKERRALTEEVRETFGLRCQLSDQSTRILDLENYLISMKKEKDDTLAYLLRELSRVSFKLEDDQKRRLGRRDFGTQTTTPLVDSTSLELMLDEERRLRRRAECEVARLALEVMESRP